MVTYVCGDRAKWMGSAIPAVDNAFHLLPNSNNRNEVSLQSIYSFTRLPCIPTCRACNLTALAQECAVMQRALKAHQEIELAEAARALNLDHNDSRAVFRHSLNGKHMNGSGSGASTSTARSTSGEASAGSSSSESGKGTGAHTPMARPSHYQTNGSQPIPLSFAATREHLEGIHNPPPGTLHLSPGLGGPSNGKATQSSNYELGTSFIDSTLSASPFANGNYTEVLGGKSD